MARHERALSPREREVVGLIAAGLTGRQVAERLGIAVGTVRAHTQVARMKLGVDARVRFAKWLVLQFPLSAGCTGPRLGNSAWVRPTSLQAAVDQMRRTEGELQY